MAATSNAIKKLLNSEQIKYAESVIKDYNQILKNKHNPNMSGYERRQSLQQFYKQYSPENLEVTNYEQRISELNEIREHYSEPDFQFTDKTNSLYRAFLIPNSEYRMVLPNPNTTLENQAYEMAGAKELFGDEIKYRDNFHVSSPAFIKNEDDKIKIIKQGSIHNDSRDKYLVKLDNNDIDSSNNFSTTVKKQNVTSSSIENNSNSKVNSASTDVSISQPKEEVPISEPDASGFGHIRKNVIGPSEKSVDNKWKNFVNWAKEYKQSTSNTTQPLQSGPISANDFAAMSGSDNRASSYMGKRLANRLNETNAKIKAIQDNADLSEADKTKQINDIYAVFGDNVKNMNDVQQSLFEQAKRGPSAWDYAMGYKVPQAITGVTLLGGMVSMALGNNKGQKTNAELYSNPF